MMASFKHLLLFLILFFAYSLVLAQPIDRQALVSRHHVKNTSFDTLGTLSVGNGGFAFSVDVTGLQTFSDEYKNGIPLGTQSGWGWHSFPNTQGYHFNETFRDYEVNGRNVPYAVQPKDPKHAAEASDYFRSNPHRLHLGVIGFQLKGKELAPADISNIRQELNLWTGEITSSFEVLEKTVHATTLCHPEQDMVAIRIQSDLLKTGSLKITFDFPYPTGAHTDMAAAWSNPEAHSSILEESSKNSGSVKRILDSTTYYTDILWNGKAALKQQALHTFDLSPSSEILEVSVLFRPENKGQTLESFEVAQAKNREKWTKFWSSGGAVDFSGSTDPRALELERRTVLSQYLTAVQCAGNYPPQETGLTFNSWFGKFHLEMVWWHAVHFALWNRVEYIEKMMPWYSQVADEARELARRQGYDGVRWQKMTGPSGAETSSSVGSFLIWQQPHYIYLAELCYRKHADTETLNRYKDLVFETADFMASYPWFDEEKQKYTLGPALIPAQECFDASSTINSPFELVYWHWGLKTAIEWAERLDLPVNKKWQEVVDQLSPLAITDGLYVPAESVPLAYQNHSHMHDHPMPLGALGMMPKTELVDALAMQKTFDFIWKNWEWEQTWGWDFPMTSMTATRLGEPEKAVDALFMDVQTNTYLPNGHNYQDGRLRLYLPGNGGLLTAIALMCAGFDACTVAEPGIPKDESWKVRWEGLMKMP